VGRVNYPGGRQEKRARGVDLFVSDGTIIPPGPTAHWWRCHQAQFNADACFKCGWQFMPESSI